MKKKKNEKKKKKKKKKKHYWRISSAFTGNVLFISWHRMSWP